MQNTKYKIHNKGMPGAKTAGDAPSNRHCQTNRVALMITELNIKLMNDECKLEVCEMHC